MRDSIETLWKLGGREGKLESVIKRPTNQFCVSWTSPLCLSFRVCSENFQRLFEQTFKQDCLLWKELKVWGFPKKTFSFFILKLSTPITLNSDYTIHVMCDNNSKAIWKLLRRTLNFFFALNKCFCCMNSKTASSLLWKTHKESLSLCTWWSAAPIFNLTQH